MPQQRQSNREILFDISGGTPKVLASRQDVPVSPLDVVAQLGELITQGSGKVFEAAGAATGAPEVERTLTGKGNLLDILSTVGTAADVATPAIPLLPLLGALFHGTSSLRVPGILKKGLRARREVGMADPRLVPRGGSGKREAAFLTDDLMFAEQAAEMKAAGDVHALSGKLNRNRLASVPPGEHFLDATGQSNPFVQHEAAEKARALIERQVQPTVLEFPESVRAGGIPDVRFVGEKATMFPEGLNPGDVTRGAILPSDFQMIDFDIEDLFRSVSKLGADANARIVELARILSGFRGG